MIYDCIIVGGGPAGLSAALVLGRAGRNTLLFDENKPRNAVTHASHGFLTRDGVKPADFREIGQREIRRYPSVKCNETRINEVVKTEFGFSVVTENREIFETRKLVLAMGMKEVFPSIYGFRDFYGKSLFQCPYCDGWENRNKALLLVCEAEQALKMAKLVYNWSKDLVVFTNGNPVNLDVKDILQSRGIMVVTAQISSFIGEAGCLEKVRFEDGTFIHREAGFVTPKLIPNSLIGCDKLGYQTTEMGGIATDGYGRTSVKGLYAAGDLAVISPSQVVISTAEGSRAAIGVNTDLTEELF